VGTSYLAECFWPGVTREAVEAADRRARKRAAELHKKGSSIRYVGSLVMPGDEVVVFEFDATSEEAVAQLCQDAEIPVDRLVESVRVGQGARAEEGDG
jgi:hypothetical protein